MKTYDVTLIRQVSQTAVIRVEADNGIDAVDNAIALSNPNSDWEADSIGETFYREVKEVKKEHDNGN